MPLTSAQPVNALELMPQERAEFVALLNSLDEEQLAGPTKLPSWSVRDVYLHVLQGDLALLARMRDGYTNPTPAPPSDLDGLVEWLAKRNRRWVTGARFLSRQLIGELLTFTGDLTHDVLGSLALNEPGETVSWAGEEAAPNWLVIAREFTERWVHQQDVRDALGRPGLNGPSFVRPLLSIAMRGVLNVYRDIDAKEGTIVTFDIEGRGGGGWAVRRDVEGWSLLEGRERQPAASITLDQDGAWRHLYRRLGDGPARMTRTGPKKLTAPFLRAVAALVPR